MAERPSRIVLGTIIDHWFRRLILGTRRVSLNAEEFATHKHIIGVTGTGKTSLIVYLMYQMLQAGIPFTLLDPLGPASEGLLRLLVGMGYFNKPNAFQKFYFVEWTDKEGGYYPKFNVLKQPGVSPAAMGSQIAEACYRIWPVLNQAVWFETATKYSVQVLTAAGLTLPALEDFLRNKELRDRLLVNLDPDVKSFFAYLDGIKNEVVREERIVTASTRAQIFRYEPALKYTLGQSELSLPTSTIIQNNISVVHNLRGVISDDARRMLGSLIAVSNEQAALQRPEPNPTQYHFLMEEMSEFVNKSGDSLERMLSKTRNFNYYVWLIHQQLGQLTSTLQAAVQNVGVSIALGLGRSDSEVMVKTVGKPLDLDLVKEESTTDTTHPVFRSVQEQWEEQIAELAFLPNRRMKVRIGRTPPIDGITLDLPSVTVSNEEVKRIKQVYREQLSTKQSDIVLPHQNLQPQSPGRKTRGLD